MRRDGVIEVLPRGVSIRDRRGKLDSFEWNELDRILAYKLDLITTDKVCLEFIAGDRSYVADEEAVGWENLTAQLSERFAIAETWLETVTQPPFATNMCVLWNRPTQASEDGSEPDAHSVPPTP